MNRAGLREVSVKGCPVIGGGHYSTVYKLDNETVVKVYDRSPVTLEKIEQDKKTARQVFLKDIPTAISYDVVRIGEHYGIVYEMIDADTMSGAITKNPERLHELSVKAATLLKKLHSIELEAGILPDMSGLYGQQAQSFLDDGIITPSDKDMLDRLISKLTTRKAFIHMDFHPKNIMVQNGELVLLDVGDSGMGNPMIDLASLYCMLFTFPQATRGGPHQADVEDVLGMSTETASRVLEEILSAYLGTTDKETLSGCMQTIKYFTAFRFIWGIRESGLHSLDRLKELARGLIDSVTGNGTAITPIEGIIEA